jgi:hypothetical protein
MPTYQNVTPPISLMPRDVGFSFNNEAFPGSATAGSQFAIPSLCGPARDPPWEPLFLCRLLDHLTPSDFTSIAILKNSVPVGTEDGAKLIPSGPARCFPQRAPSHPRKRNGLSLGEVVHLAAGKGWTRKTKQRQRLKRRVMLPPKTAHVPLNFGIVPDSASIGGAPLSSPAAERGNDVQGPPHPLGWRTPRASRFKTLSTGVTNI